MRKITTRGERKETRNKVIIGLVLVAVMVFGTIGFAFFSGSEEEKVEKVDYNGVEFILNENGLWQFETQNFGFLTSFNPKDTENISVPVFMTTGDYYRKPLFFLGQGRARQEIERGLRNFASRSQDACIGDYEDICEKDAPIKTCSEENIMVFIETDDIEISQEDNCIFISSPHEEQIRAANALLFKILGIRGI